MYKMKGRGNTNTFLKICFVSMKWDPKNTIEHEKFFYPSLSLASIHKSKVCLFSFKRKLIALFGSLISLSLKRYYWEKLQLLYYVRHLSFYKHKLYSGERTILRTKKIYFSTHSHYLFISSLYHIICFLSIYFLANRK